MRFLSSAATSFIVFILIANCVAYNCVENQRRLGQTGTCNKDSEILCRDICSGDMIVSRKNCSTQIHCCYRKGKCILKIPVISQEVSRINLEAVGANFASGLKPKQESISTDARFFTLGGNTNTGNTFNLNAGFPNTGGPSLPTGNFPFTGGLPGTGFTTGVGGLGSFGQQCLPFPNNCQVQFTSVHDMQPPINIPYCQRIECPGSGLLHTDISQCLSTPGCAFDYELYRFRSVLGQAILPDVPVCHLAIRNEGFLKQAKQYTQKSGQPWNPLLTNCLIEEYSDKILGGSPGCYMVDVLIHFNNYAKRAGWQGISEYECYLIDGCWRPSIGCLYPVRLDQITVRSGNNDKPAQPTERDLFGQSLCLPFDSTSTNGDFLNNYHSCLTAGCAVNVNTDTLLQQLYGVATSYFSSYQLQQQFWNMVTSGRVRADNWKQVADQIIADNKQNNPLGNNALSNLFGNLNNPMAAGSTNPNTLQNLFNFYSSSLRPSAQTPASNQIPDILAYSLNLNSTQGRQFNLPSGNLQPSAVSSANPINSLLGLNIGNIGLSSIYKPPCPYKNIDWPGIPPLAGSFVGCCEQPLCYTPRSGLYRQYSGVSSYITEWAPWGVCSKTCGSGYQYRERRCVGRECGEPEQETQTCNTQICPFWLEWSSFQSCSKPCGGGEKTRTRSCSAGYGCEGKSSEQESCNSGKCAVLTKWSAWSECQTTCGVGKKARDRTCRDGGEYGCPTSLEQEKDCVVYCGQLKYAESSPCNPESCTSTRTVSCVKADGSEGYCRQDQMKPKVSRCYEGRCFCRYFPNNYPCNVNLFNG